MAVICSSSHSVCVFDSGCQAQFCFVKTKQNQNQQQNPEDLLNSNIFKLEQEIASFPDFYPSQSCMPSSYVFLSAAKTPEQYVSVRHLQRQPQQHRGAQPGRVGGSYRSP